MAVTFATQAVPRGSAAAADPLRTRQRTAGCMLAAPAALLMGLLIFAPSAAVLVFSVTDYRFGLGAPEFAGLDNYVALFADPKFHRSFVNTFVYALIVVPGAVGLALVLALLIEQRGVLRSFYRTVYFLPVVGTLVAVATAWEVILHPSFGFANVALSQLGLERQRFLADADLALLTLAGIGIWQLVGFNLILFLAGLSTIPQDLIDAAAVDGAGGLDRFRLVIWPMLGPVTMFVLVLSAIRAFSVFETVAVLTQGGPNNASQVLLYTLYEEGFRYLRIGYASALTVVFLVVTAGIMLLKAWYLDKRVHYR